MMTRPTHQKNKKISPLLSCRLSSPLKNIMNLCRGVRGRQRHVNRGDHLAHPSADSFQWPLTIRDEAPTRLPRTPATTHARVMVRGE